MKVLITGASGLVGLALTSFLKAKGHEVIVLSRHSGPGIRVWSPETGFLDLKDVEGVDAVVNLAGENIASSRWTVARKQEILESRLKATHLVCNSIAEMKNPPKVLINASAVGFYGDRGDDIVDERSGQGQGFLSDVCSQWEAATKAAKDKGVRVVFLRLGVVLSKKGGALAKMLPPFKWGLGGNLGSGQQYMSWISLDEVVRVVEFILNDDAIVGPVNAVAPCPVTNAAFTKTLGRVLNRPTFFAMPAFAARLVFGELADELLLSGTRAHPLKLQQANYLFVDTNLENVLRRETSS